MHIGETSVRLTSLLAAGLRRPKFRTDLIVSRQVVLGEVSYVLKIPETDSYYRFQDIEYETLTLFDGRRTFREVWEELRRRYPETHTTLTDVEDFASGADPDLWEKTLTEKNLALLEKIRSERRERAERSSLFYLSFSAFNPDAFFTKIHPYLRWVWSPGFFWATLVLFVLAGWVFVSEWDQLMADTVALYTFQNKSLADLVQVWILILAGGFIHECGHGLTCKHYGGEVKQMGFMLIYFMPAFFTNVSDIYLFDKDSKRFWTIFAGIWIEAVACAVAIIFWLLATPGTAFYNWTYKAVLITSISGLVINLNPLMKFDGYYALCQWAKVDNLREDAFEYLKNLVHKHIFRQDVEPEEVGRRRRRLFLVFGPAAVLYSVVILAVIILFAKNILTSQLGLWGWALTAAFAWLVLRRRLSGQAGFLRERISRLREWSRGWGVSRRIQFATGGVVLALFLLPASTRVSTGFVLQPGARAFVRAETPGWIEGIKVEEGERVAARAVVAILRNPEVEVRTEILERRLLAEERALAAASAEGDPGTFREHWQRREQLRLELAQARAHLARLVLRTSVGGIVTTPRLAERIGRFLAEGETFCEVVEREPMRARVLVPDRDVERIRVGSRVELNVRAQPWTSFAGQVGSISPAAAVDLPPGVGELPGRRGASLYNYFAVELDFSNPGQALREGMTGTAKIYGRRLPLGVQGARGVWWWLRSKLW